MEVVRALRDASCFVRSPSYHFFVIFDEDEEDLKANEYGNMQAQGGVAHSASAALRMMVNFPLEAALTICFSTEALIFALSD